MAAVDANKTIVVCSLLTVYFDVECLIGGAFCRTWF